MAFHGLPFGHFLDRHKPFHHILKNGHIGKKIVKLKNHGRIAADMKDFLFAGAFHINDGFLIKLKRPFISGSQKLMVLKKVVFPLPEGPMMTVTLPVGTSRLTSFRTGRFP